MLSSNIWRIKIIMADMMDTLLKYLNGEIDQDDLDAAIDDLANYQAHLVGED